MRTGRAHTGILDHVMVDYYGTQMPLNQVANISLLDARTISISPWEKKMGPVVEKAIRDADLGLNPAAMGDLIRVPMPSLTEERRKDLTKVVRSEAENARVAIRNVRRDAITHLKDLLKAKSVSEDEERSVLGILARLLLSGGPETGEVGAQIARSGGHEHLQVRMKPQHGVSRQRRRRAASSIWAVEVRCRQT